MGAIFVVLGAVFIYLLQLYLYERFWSRGLSARVDFAQEVLVEQEKGQLKEVISNEKFLPLPMIRVKFQLDRSFHFEQEGNVTITDRCYKNDIFSILFYQRVTRTLEFEARKRGYFTIDQMDLVSSDLFFTTNMLSTVPCHTALYVYPRYVDLERLAVPFQSMMGAMLTRQFAYEDPFEFRGIRAYQAFDSQKDINWKASAKTGDLKVNLHNYTARQEICILLNLEPDGALAHDLLREEGIRIASTLAEMFLAQGVVVSLYGNGHDILTEELCDIPAGGGSTHLTAIRERLARIDLTKECEEYGPLLDGYLERAGKHALFVLISSSQRERIGKCFQDLCRKSEGSTWILPLHEDMRDTSSGSGAGRVVRWEVAKA